MPDAPNEPATAPKQDRISASFGPKPRAPSTPVDTQSRAFPSARTALTLLVLLSVAGAAVVAWDGWPIASALAVVISAWATVVFVLGFLTTMDRGESQWFESHWGGLGGGVNGFRMPTPWLFLGAALGFGLMLVLAMSGGGQQSRSPKEDAGNADADVAARLKEGEDAAEGGESAVPAPPGDDVTSGSSAGAADGNLPTDAGSGSSPAGHGSGPPTLSTADGPGE